MLRTLAVTLAATLLAGVAGSAEPQLAPKGTPSGPAQGAPLSRISNHPYGDTPLKRTVVLAHTDALPECDKVVVYALRYPHPPSKKPRPSIPPEVAYPIRASDEQAAIVGERTLGPKDSRAVCAAWRRLGFDTFESAFCHLPVYGLRFYRNDRLLFETSVCWQCTNFYLPNVSPPRADHPDTRLSGLSEWRPYQWYGFKKDKASADLLAMLRKAVPHPDLEE